jgi:SulP family sulfate permease
VIRLRRVPFIDATGIQSIEEATIDLHKRGVQVFLCEAYASVIQKIRRSGLVDEHAFATYCDTIEQAFEQARVSINANEF